MSPDDNPLFVFGSSKETRIHLYELTVLRMMDDMTRLELATGRATVAAEDIYPAADLQHFPLDWTSQGPGAARMRMREVLRVLMALQTRLAYLGERLSRGSGSGSGFGSAEDEDEDDTNNNSDNNDKGPRRYTFGVENLLASKGASFRDYVRLVEEGMRGATAAGGGGWTEAEWARRVWQGIVPAIQNRLPWPEMGLLPLDGGQEGALVHRERPARVDALIEMWDAEIGALGRAGLFERRSGPLFPLGKGGDAAAAAAAAADSSSLLGSNMADDDADDKVREAASVPLPGEDVNDDWLDAESIISREHPMRSEASHSASKSSSEVSSRATSPAGYPADKSESTDSQDSSDGLDGSDGSEEQALGDVKGEHTLPPQTPEPSYRYVNVKEQVQIRT